ncbi:protein Skeletor, isoforms B/C isoform X5 [Danaus plexippus]|uniref:protein Skeletor, isoforms B/C isoform X5 n=1 Tax=Danaus plexippus TaxID=13037 RepID=UPI002AAF371E|nr:protein Skeletor, isoforms B/C isoform X5 [Danaus plexippus]
MRLQAALALLLLGVAQARYHGKEIGPLSELHHGVRGRVFAVDSRTLYLHDFTYDGEGPAAYFYVGTSKTPSATGATRVRDERGMDSPLRRYRGEGLTVSLPEGKTLKDVSWFAVWCDEYSINFGSVMIPRSLEYPKPARLSPLRGVHGVWSEPLVIVDAQTLLVPNFSYDGEAPDAKFWVGRGDNPSPAGIRIPDENGKESPLRKYSNKTIVLTLPGELTVFDIGHFAVWCEAFTVNFGHVVLTKSALTNVPPSLKMLGVSPQTRNKALSSGVSPGAPTRAPPRARRPLVRLDATTYRPRLLAGPPAQSQASEQTPHAQRRRADEYTSPTRQLIPSEHKSFEILRSEEIEQPPHIQHSIVNDPSLGERGPSASDQRILSTQELLEQQQLYEQQRVALQKELEQYRRFQYQQEPLQYGLLQQGKEEGR